MNGGGRCGSCGWELTTGARFCAGCAAPIGTSTEPTEREMVPSGGPGTAVVSHGPGRWAIVAVVGVGLLVAVLSVSRSGSDDETAAPPTTAVAPTTTVTPTTTPSTTMPAMTTSTQPTATLPPSGFVDVTEVPSDLADLTLVLFGPNLSAALDLGTGELTSFVAPEAPEGSDVLLRATPAGVLQWTNAGGPTSFVDWAWSEGAALPDSVWPGSVQVDGDLLWYMDYSEHLALEVSVAGGEPSRVRELDGWIELVGHSDDAALVSSMMTGQVHRIDRDGTIAVAHDGVALGGGDDWLVSPGCDAELRCSLELVDLRTGSEFSFGPQGSVDGSAVTTSWDGRRGLLQAWDADGPTLWIIDADVMSATPAHSSFAPLDTDLLVTDPGLRYAIEPSSRRISIAELTTGERWEVELPELVTSLVVAPGGWSPPA